MTTFEDVHLQNFEVPAIRHDLVQIKERVVPTPEQKTRRLVLPMVCLDGRKACDVVPVILEEFELNLDVAGSGHSLPIQEPAFGRVKHLQALRQVSNVLGARAFEVQPFG
jgi:hypothetical protein